MSLFHQGSFDAIQTPAIRLNGDQRLPGPNSELPSNRHDASMM
jgi:hypothetical protein